MARLEDLLAVVKRETGVTLVNARDQWGKRGWHDETTAQVQNLTIGVNVDRAYYSQLIGPFLDPDNGDVRLFMQHRQIDGTETVTLLVQDADDDAFLSPQADGTAKYRAGWPFYVKP